MTRGEKAESLFREGCACAQAVLLAFEDLLSLDRETLMRLSSPFGGGMGRLRETCGAVSGMAFVLGALYGYDDPKVTGASATHYARVQEVAGAFKTENGSIICRELLGGNPSTGGAPEPRTAEYYKKRPCAELVGIAAEILDDYIERNPF